MNSTEKLIFLAFILSSSIKKYLVYPLSVPQIQGVSDLDAQGKTVPVEVFLESFKQTKIIKKHGRKKITTHIGRIG